MPYEVQHHKAEDGWINRWSYEEFDGLTHLETFATPEEAQAAIDEYIDDHEEEYLANEFERSDFRIRYVLYIQSQPTTTEQGERP